MASRAVERHQPPSPCKNGLLTASPIGGSMLLFERRPASSGELPSGVSIAAGCRPRLVRFPSERSAEIGLAVTGSAGNSARVRFLRPGEADVNVWVN